MLLIILFANTTPWFSSCRCHMQCWASGATVSHWEATEEVIIVMPCDTCIHDKQLVQSISSRRSLKPCLEQSCCLRAYQWLSCGVGAMGWKELRIHLRVVFFCMKSLSVLSVLLPDMKSWPWQWLDQTERRNTLRSTMLSRWGPQTHKPSRVFSPQGCATFASGICLV